VNMESMWTRLQAKDNTSDYHCYLALIGEIAAVVNMESMWTWLQAKDNTSDNHCWFWVGRLRLEKKTFSNINYSR
jgi:hypothetical protein